VNVAYVVFSHRYPEQVVRLLRVLRAGSPGARLISHDDGSLAVDGLGVERILPPTRVSWGGASQLAMMLRGLRFALSGEFDWLVLLSGQDYPLRPLASIERDLAADGVDGFVEGVQVPPPPGDEFTRRYFYRYRRVRPLVGRVLGPLLPTRVLPHGTVVGRPVTPPLLPVRRGSDWLSLSRRAVQAVVDAPPEVLDHFRRTVAPTEGFPQTVLYAKPGLRLSGDTRRFTRWVAGAPHPQVLGVGDLDAMLASGLDFARKFDASVDAQVLDELDRIVL
jgi:hypothetical protein